MKLIVTKLVIVLFVCDIRSGCVIGVVVMLEVCQVMMMVGWKDL